MSIEKIRNIGLDKLVTQVYDFDGLTTDELMCKFAQKINIIIEHFNYLDDRCYNSDKAMELKLQYLLGQGLEEQVAKRVVELINNGTLGNIINQTLLKDINNKVDNFKVEVNEELDNKAYKTYVTYKEFGAKLNGIDDDTQYIKACHIYANNNGLKVVQQNSLIVLSEEIEVKTDLDLTGSTIISKLIDDDVPYNRTKSLFKIIGKPLTPIDVVGALTKGSKELNVSSNGFVAIMGNEIYMKRYNLGLETDVFNWENNYINNKKLTYPLINNHTNYTVSIREDDIPLSLKGCKFITEFSTSKALSLFRVERNNVTIDNVQLFTNGSGTISPLYSIVNVNKCCNVTLNNIQCDKMSATEGNGLSYFILLEMCNNISINNSRQGRVAWSGINGNWVRDIKANNCELFMFGCHAFGSDMAINNSKIFNGIEIHGTGELNVENCTFYDNGISNKLDYGGEFRGTWNIKNCKAYNIQRFIYLYPPNYNHGIECAMPNININGLYFESEKTNNSIVYFGYLDNQAFDSYLCKNITLKNIIVETTQKHHTFESIFPFEKNLFTEMNLTIDNVQVKRESYETHGWDGSYSNIQIPIIKDTTILNVNVNNSTANLGVKGTRNVNVKINNSDVLILRTVTGLLETEDILKLTIENSKITRPYCNLNKLYVNLVNKNNMFMKDSDGIIGNGFAECVKYASNNVCEVGATIREMDKPGLFNYIDSTYWSNS